MPELLGNRNPVLPSRQRYTKKVAQGLGQQDDLTAFARLSLPENGVQRVVEKVPIPAALLPQLSLRSDSNTVS